jgi:hypothetical protein
MFNMKRAFLFAVVVSFAPALVAAEDVNLQVVNRIKTEAFENSKVMDHLFYLTDVYGPRVAASPNYRKAAAWTVKQLKEWGLEDAGLEKWGTFGRAWSWSRVAVQMLEPQQTTLIGIPLAWSPATPGVVTADAILAPMSNVADGEKYKGKLKGKIVLLEEASEVKLGLEADARRLGDADLASRALAPEPAPASPSTKSNPEARNKFLEFLKHEGVAAALTTGMGGSDGTIFTAPAGSRNAKDPLPPPSIALAKEHYNRLARLLAKGIPVKLELEVRAENGPDAAEGVNVIANLRGSSRKDEIVMLGAHLDSWQAGTGATDNAAGCAVVLEAVRILAALKLDMSRTVRVALWDAEEQGLLGSRGYVTAHFAERETMERKADYARLAGYFNLDNGAGKIRGVYLQNNDMMRPVFEAWLAPFKDLGATTVAIRNTRGTDHLSFDEVGLPGFRFIQDPLDYSTRTHHTNMDVYERVPRADLMQAAAIMASFVYNAATRQEMLPRKPAPKPGTNE